MKDEEYFLGNGRPDPGDPAKVGIGGVAGGFAAGVTFDTLAATANSQLKLIKVNRF